MFFRLKLVESSSFEELLGQFKTISAGTSTLDLSWNELHKLSEEQLEQLCLAIPLTVTSVNFGWNRLGKGLSRALLAIKAPLRQINFVGNDFTDLQLETSVQIMRALPATLTSLDLSFSLLSDLMRGEELAQILQAIPPGVRSLNLGTNHLYLKSVEELAMVLRAVPKTVLAINLGEDIFQNRTKSEEAELSAVLREVDPKTERLSYANCPTKSLSMQIVGIFITGLGIAAVALAFTVLSGGIPGLVLGLAGVAGILAGVGLFAFAGGREAQKESSEDLNENNSTF